MKNFVKLTTVLFSIVLIIIFSASSQKGVSIKGTISTDAGKEKYKVNTIVYIEKVNGNFTPPKVKPVMDQKGLTFIPRVLPILVGTTVDFLNNDNVPHNVFCPDKCCDKFDLGSWPKGKVRSYTFKNAGCQAVILCNVHPEMEAYVVVLQNPYFTLTDANGNFEIKNVPAGEYTLKVWNEKLKADVQKIKVTSTGITTNFKLRK